MEDAFGQILLHRHSHGHQGLIRLRQPNPPGLIFRVSSLRVIPIYVKLLDGAVSGLPHWLPTEDGYEPFRYAPWLVLGLSEEARNAAQPTFLPPSEGAAYGQTDVASPVFLAWQRAETVGRCLDSALATVASVSLHALDTTGRAPPRGIANLTE
jgi:hypothetical protein